MRKTKIVCTLGPATDREDVLRQLIVGGMNVARFNFSHGTHDEHLKRLTKLREIREELDLPIAALLDTRGPEIRIGTFKEGKISLKRGKSFTLTTRDNVVGDENIVHVNYKNIIDDIEVGGQILIDDGLVSLKITDIRDEDIICLVENDGVISDKKGVNLPNCDTSMPYISESDYADILFGIEQGFDFIAASFVRSASDVLEIRKILNEHNSRINIISKIENMQGVNNIDEIIRVSDGIMVARGDLGVEIPLEEVPVIQKELISKGFNAERRVITATQMLDSMMKNPRPTRAEATDVANAIYDGTSAIMLSGETAAGAYPVEALMTMDRIARRTEEDIDYVKRFKNRVQEKNPDVTNAIAHATCMTAIDLDVSAIITVTKSGNTAKLISKYRPNAPIIGCTMSNEVCRQLSMSWGVVPMLIKEEKDTDVLFERAIDSVIDAGYIKPGDLTVITAGVPLGISGTTNLLKVTIAGNILVRGKGIGKGTLTAPVIVCKDIKELPEKHKDGCILVVPDTDNSIMRQLRSAKGLIVESPDENSHAAIVGMSLDIPVIIGAKNATDILKTGSILTMNVESGLINA